MTAVEVGMRVVRGPDWRWGEQDGGEGHAGTVVEVGKPGSSTTPDKTVVIQWDAGSRTNYRTGYQSAFDLRLVDNAPVGVKHANHICDGCKKQGVSGVRWECRRCVDYDLCTICYMADKHDLNHSFLRFESNMSRGVECPPRKNSLKVPLMGIFVGAKVLRGPDWDWGNQDGGEGKCGRVTEIRGWDNESGRSVASVTWACGTTNVYRVGHKGKVDIKYIQPAGYGTIYIKHLPVLGKQDDSGGANISDPMGVAVCASHPHFSVGERVRVGVGLEQLRSMQEGHGGWNQKMSEIMDKVGFVHRITDKGDVRVEYEGFPSRWTIHPAALIRATAFNPGDTVRILNDGNRVKNLQKGHGEWIDYMKGALGKSGTVSKVYPDNDLRVIVDGKTWTFNPQCATLILSSTDHNNTMKANERNEPLGPVLPCSVLNDGAAATAATSLVDHLVREAAQGNTQVVQSILQEHPDKVDCLGGGKSCLQVCCHQGHLDLVRLLLQNHNTSIQLPDEDGDTPLHYSAFGNQPEIMELLLRKGANINALNRGRCSALHVAVNKQHPSCVKVLLKYECDINVQDSYGDTALHDAIGKNSIEILDMLTNCPHINLMLKNKRGFNVLHHAALKGNNFATEKLVQRARHFVDVKKEDGFAALHLAALNGHRQVADTLLTLGMANSDIRNNKRQTPLLLAISQCHLEVSELLVAKNADVQACDEDGDTALHLALQRTMTPDHAPRSFSPQFSAVLARMPGHFHEEAPRVTCEDERTNHSTTKVSNMNMSLALSCFLVQKGASLGAVNARGRRPLDFITDPSWIDVLQSYTVPSSQESDRGMVIDMDIRALDLAADSLRSEHSSVPSARGACATNQYFDHSRTHPDNPLLSRHSSSQPVSPAHLNQLRGGTAACGNSASTVETPLPQLSNSLSRDTTSSGDEVSDNVVSACDRSQCTICSENVADVVFKPCDHVVTCNDCSKRVKKCLQCKEPVVAKVTRDGRILSTKQQPPPADRLRYLESKIEEIEEAHSCSICMERRRNVAFLCGHSACVVCAHPLKTCHMCRKPITRKINLY